MKRTMVDQYFSRIINGFAGVIINTGEDDFCFLQQMLWKKLIPYWLHSS